MRSKWKRWEATEERWARKLEWWNGDGKARRARRSDVFTTLHHPMASASMHARHTCGWRSSIRPRRVLRAQARAAEAKCRERAALRAVPPSTRN